MPKFREDEVIIEMIDATACCGDGVDNLPEKVCGHWRLPLSEFKTLASGAPENIKMLRVQGDSMTPTISEGDFVWVDTSNNYIGSDGIGNRYGHQRYHEAPRLQGGAYHT